MGEPENLPESLTGLAVAAASLHEMFTSLIEAGFTERQSCLILGELLRGGQS